MNLKLGLSVPIHNNTVAFNCECKSQAHIVGVQSWLYVYGCIGVMGVRVRVCQGLCRWDGVPMLHCYDIKTM